MGVAAATCAGHLGKISILRIRTIIVFAKWISAGISPLLQETDRKATRGMEALRPRINCIDRTGGGDAAGNVYIVDTNIRWIRKVDATGTITTIAGTGDFGDSTGVSRVASVAAARPLTQPNRHCFDSDDQWCECDSRRPE